MSLPLLPVVIKEIGGLQRPIVLYDTTLPREGSETTLGERMRGKETWYTGATEATVQVLGPSYEPIRFAGMLEDRRTGVPGSAVLLMWLIRMVGKAGRIVLFNYGPILRRCRWVRHSFKIRSLQQIAYEIELQPIGDEQRDRKRIKKGINATPSVDKVLELSAEVDGDLVQVGGKAATQASGEMQKVLELTIEGSESLEGVAQQGAVVDQSLASLALSKFDSARSALGNAVNHIRDLGWEDVSQSDFAALAGRGLDVLNIHSGVNAVAQALGDVRTKVAALAGEATGGQIYIAAGGDTLHSIAKEFYGTADRWFDIMRANGKQVPTVDAGEQLLLRDVPTADVVTAP
jgi:hypothetical protein